MRTFEFSVIASGVDPSADNFESLFYDNACGDALVSFQKGHVIIDFAREAETMDEAILSALADVAATGAQIDRVEPDPLVSLSEIAKRAGMTRAAITNYHKGRRGEGFPAPVVRVTSESPLWDWASVAKWLVQNNRLPRNVAIEAETLRQANHAVEHGDIYIGPKLKRRVAEYEAKLSK